MTWNVITTQITGHTVTAAEWNDIGANMSFLRELAYDEITADVGITATTEGTANNVISGTNRTYSGTSPIMVHFFSPGARADNGAAGRVLHLMLFDGATVVGEIGNCTTPAASNAYNPISCYYRLTPTAALHQYGIKAWVSAGTGNVYAAAGGTGTRLPAFIRTWYVPT